MPTAALPFCPVAGCSQRSHGLCDQHRSAKRQRADAYRDSRHARGYTSQWVRFREMFFRMLLERHIIPKCGARLDGSPSPDSHCDQRGRTTLETTTDLHVDHAVPLEPWERSRPDRVLDPMRCQLLCGSCHSAKTRRERHA
jgi:5-methylcytosine-specific restriction endonuclease McrA